MDRLNILITGATGMLGATLAKTLSNDHNVFATGNSPAYFLNSIKYNQFNLTRDDYDSLISWSKPDIIIHCAAITNGNECQNSPILAFDINSFSLQKLIDATSENTKIIYISSDAVFPSNLHLAKENDTTNAENIYGKSKELGEFLLLQSQRNFTIIRTTIVGTNINPNKQSFVEWIINSLQNNIEISLFDDVLFTPIDIWSLATEIDRLIITQNTDKILHITGKEECTKYEFGLKLSNALGLDSDLIKKGSILEFSDRAKRCTDQTLNTTHYKRNYNRILPGINQIIEHIKIRYNEKNKIGL